MRAAVIGAGHIGRQHVAALSSLTGVQLVGVCDRSRVRAEALAEEFLAPWYGDHADLLAEAQPDVIHIATPAATHFPLALAALDAGAHVLVEKPITVRLSELERLQQRAAEKRLALLEDHNYLFNRPLLAMREWAADGSFGEIIQVDIVFAVDICGAGGPFADPNSPHPSLSLPGGAISDFLIHMAYLACAFAGPHRHVAAWWRRSPGSPLPHDELRALVDAERSCVSLTFSGRARPAAFLVRVIGSRRRAEANLLDHSLVVDSERAGPGLLTPLGNQVDRGSRSLRAAWDVLRDKLAGGPAAYEGLATLIERLYQALRAGGDPPVRPSEIAAAHRLTAAIIEQSDRP